MRCERCRLGVSRGSSAGLARGTKKQTIKKPLKDNVTASIHWQNLQLYAWGILFNLLGAFAHDPGALRSGLFGGYNVWAVMVVINNALNGLAISAILKYADNIARVYAHAAAMVLTVLISVPLFGQKPTPQLVIAIGMVGASAVQYSVPQSQAARAAPRSSEPRQMLGKSQLADAEEEDRGNIFHPHPGFPMNCNTNYDSTIVVLFVYRTMSFRP